MKSRAKEKLSVILMVLGVIFIRDCESQLSLTCLTCDIATWSSNSSACEESCSSACYVGLDESGLNVRGCASDFQNANQCSSSVESTAVCFTCTEDRCNNITYPMAGRLQCYSCIEGSCEVSDDTAKYCDVYGSDEKCVTVFATNEDAVVARGCSSEVNYQTVCDNSVGNCLQCGYDKCNIDDSKLKNRITCKTCVGSACMSSEIGEKVCSFYSQESTEACITVFDENDAVAYRDCWADAPAATQELCNDASNLECTKCSTSNCNVDTRRRGSKCFKCSGVECFTPTLANVVDCQSGCFVGAAANGETIRGCESDESSCSDKSQCLLCNDDFCNGITFPTESRRLCLHCSGEDCAASEVVEFCEVYGSAEECVTVFDSAGEVTTRGCFSSLKITNNTSNIRCDFDACNTHTAITQSYYCVACDSPFDETCITSPSSAGTAACTTNECFSQVLTDGAVKRGCATDVTTSCTGDSCVRCTGSRCNTATVPTTRQSCYKCSGVDCINGLGRVEACLSLASTGCITIFGSDSLPIYRNCHADVNSVVQTLCDDESNIECTKCSASNCNTDTKRGGSKCFRCSGKECFTPTLADVVDCRTGCFISVGDLGQTVRGCATSAQHCSDNSTNCLTCTDDFCNGITFPMANRRSCLRCSGVDCATSEETQHCEIFSSSETCVTVFDSTSSAVIERGCLSSIANKNSTNQLACNFDNCNVQKSLADSNFCIACTSESDKNCILDPKVMGTVACETNVCYSRILASGVVERGCGAALTENCTNNNNCVKCTGERCNSATVPATRHSCYKCSGVDCLNGLGTASMCLEHNGSGCITIFGMDSKPTFRGCYADANSIVKTLCDDPTSVACTKCTAKNCNTHSTRRGSKCLKCSGDGCFNVTPAADVVDCPSGGCYVGINSLGQTVRGCAENFTNSSLVCASNDADVKSCLVCSNDFCNAIVYPLTNRAQCHACIGPQCAASEDNLSLCGRYRENCVTVFDANGTVVERGCQSSLVNGKRCIQSVGSCVSCGGVGCNVVTTTTARTCVSCSSQTDANCVQNPSLATTKLCSTGGCFSRLLASNGQLLRGCAEELASGVTCDSANGCELCSGTDKCNANIYPSNRLSCLTCSGSGECQKPLAKLCNIHKSGDRCVTIFDNYKLSAKGCLADQTSSNQNQCAANNVSCSLCSNKNCNTDTVRKDEICVSCSSDQDSSCAQKPSTLAASRCFSVSDGQCFTRISNGVTVRGCKGDLNTTTTAICTNDTMCSLSTGQGANKQIYPENRLKCHHCSSSTDPHCSETQTSADEILPCKRLAQTERCIKITSSSGQVLRGCEADFSGSICSEERCELCTAEGCNSSLGVRMTFSLVFMITTFILLFCL